MGAKLSADMSAALAAVASGASVTLAAERHKVTRQALYRAMKRLGKGRPRCPVCNSLLSTPIEPPDYEARVQALEAQGLTRSDAQGVVDAEIMTESMRAPMFLRRQAD